ncbi:putative mitogen-activated protein kinase kinase kinase [Helianthus anomalus]
MSTEFMFKVTQCLKEFRTLVAAEILGVALSLSFSIFHCNRRYDRCGTSSTKGSGIPISPKPSTYSLRKGYPQDINGEKVHGDIRLQVSARSAPTSSFTSPTLSPKRFSTLDIFDSALAGHQEFHMLPSSDTATKRSQPHSPPLQSPYPVSRTENNNTNVHPLPLPPSRPVSRRQSLDKSDEKLIKGQWQKGKLMGSGTYGTVYEATNRETGSLCVMKEVGVIPDDPKSSECIQQLEQVILLNCFTFPCFLVIVCKFVEEN